MSILTPLRRALPSHLCALLALTLALALHSCRSSKIVSNGTDQTMLTSKKNLVAALKEAEAQQPFQTYLTKNSSAKLTYAGKSYNLKAQIFLDYAQQTNLVAKLPFPPLVIGELELSEFHVKARSKPLNYNLQQTIPLNANTFLHPALVGRVPQFYKLFGLKDFTQFDIFITEDNLYCLSRKNSDVGVQLLVTKDLKLSEYTISSHGFTLHQSNADFQDADGLTIPTTIALDIQSEGGKADGSAVISIGKVAINGKDKISF